MIEQGQCERCAALEREVEALKSERITYETLTLSRRFYNGRDKRGCREMPTLPRVEK